MTLTLKIESHFFAWHSGSWWLVHHNTKFGYKNWKTNTQPSGNKYVSWLHNCKFPTMFFVLMDTFSAKSVNDFPIMTQDTFKPTNLQSRQKTPHQPQFRGLDIPYPRSFIMFAIPKNLYSNKCRSWRNFSSGSSKFIDRWVILYVTMF